MCIRDSVSAETSAGRGRQQIGLDPGQRPSQRVRRRRAAQRAQLSTTASLAAPTAQVRDGTVGRPRAAAADRPSHLRAGPGRLPPVRTRRSHVDGTGACRPAVLHARCLGGESHHRKAA